MYKTRPVTFDIPQGDPYQTTTISSFKGIQYSENPLNVDPNSAADLKNVYLNDSGSLTTRPRVELDSSITLPSGYRVINRIELDSNTALLQTAGNLVVELKLEIKEDSETNIVNVNLNSISISGNKISAFKKDDRIYILDGDKYLVIKREGNDYILYDVVNDSDSYIPITEIDGEYENKNAYTTYSDNILNEKYKKEIFWDGKTDISNYYDNAIEINNDYFKRNCDSHLLYQSHSESGSEPNHVRRGNKIVYSHTASTTSIIEFIVKNEDSIVGYDSEHETGYRFTLNANDIYDSSSPNLSFFACHEYYNPNKAVLYVLEDNELSKYSAALSSGEVMINNGVVDDSGINYVLIAKNDNLYLRKYIRFGGSNLTQSGSDVLVSSYSSSSYAGSSLKINDESTHILIKIHNTTGYIYYLYDVLNNNKNRIKLPAQYDWNIVSKDFSCFARRNIVYGTDSIFYICFVTDLDVNNEYNVETIATNKIKISNYSNMVKYISISNDGIIYFIEYDNTGTQSEYNLKLKYIPKPYNASLEIYTIGTGSTIDVYNSFDPDKFNFFVFDKRNGVQTNAWFIYFSESSEPLLHVTYNKPDWESPETLMDNYFRFQNNYWFYGNSNRLWRTSLNDPTYIEQYNYIDVGDSDRITGINILSDNLIAVYKKDKYYLITRTEINNDVVYMCTEAKGDIGNIPIGQTITTKYTELPVSIDDSGIFFISQVKNVTLSEHNTTSLSSQINIKFLTESNKDKMLTHNHRYWTYFVFPGDTAKIYVLDNRTNEWFYWELPEGNIISLWEETETEDNGYQYIITKYITSSGKIYALRVIDKVVRMDGNTNEYYTEYKDILSYGDSEIEWFWQSQILPLNVTKYSKTYPAIGYSKQLVQTGFLFTDTDESEEYSLDYSFNVYRKALSTTKESSISGTLNRVRSILKKTYIPRLSFLQIKLNNSDLTYIEQTNLPNSHNKLNLIQLKFKYKVMEERV